MNFIKNLRQVYNSKFNNSGEFERFYYELNEANVLSSTWCAHYSIYSKFLQYAQKVPTLDLCCGSGSGTKLISKKTNSVVVGIDYSKKSIQYAKKNNQSQLTKYFCLDLHKDLQKIHGLIKQNNIKQVFFVEGIEHIKNDYDVIDNLLDSGITSIFISTPKESENTKISKFHINPFTPTKLNSLQKKYKIEFLEFCKFITPNTLTHENYLTESFTSNPQKGLNYLFIIKCY